MNNERKINKWIISSSRPWIWEKTQYLYSEKLSLMSNLLWPGSDQRRTQGRGGLLWISEIQGFQRCYGPAKPPILKEKMLSPPLDKLLRVRPWSGYTLFISYTILSQRLNEEADWNVCMCNLEEHNQIFIEFFYTEHRRG